MMIYRVFDSFSETLEFYEVDSEELLIQQLQSEVLEGQSYLFWVEQLMDPVEGLESWRPVMELEIDSEGEIDVEELSEEEGHRFVYLYLNEELIIVDLPCLNLVRLFNQIGFPTQFNCQGNLYNPYHIVFQPDVSLESLEALGEAYQLEGTFISWENAERRLGWAYTVNSFDESASDFIKLSRHPLWENRC